MIYRKFNDKKISLLGFGTMRLPTTENGKIDEVQTADMVKIAMEHGVNYFDTAYPYHGGESETVIGKILGNYPRESYFLATKFPGHQIADSYDPAAIFEEQLQKCGVKYFDFVGVVSGDDVPDKLQRAGWTTEKSDFVNAPIINELPMAFECELVEFSPYGVVGRIKNVSIDENVLNEDGSLNIDKMGVITFDPINMAYVKLGEKVGNTFSDGNKIK